MKIEGAKSVAFVRFTPHDTTSGHFESLRLLQTEAATSMGVTLHFWDLSAISSKLALQEIIQLAQQFSIQHIYCEWLHDISEIEEIDSLTGRLKIKWSVLASISELWNKRQDSSFEKKISSLKNCLNLSAVFVWDSYAVHNLPANNIPFVIIPDSQSVQTDNKEYFCCSWNSKGNSPTLGIVGQLYGYRGTSALIKLAARQPSLRYIFWGAGRWNTVKKRHRILLEILKRLNIVLVNDTFMPNEEKLNHIFQHLDALFLDGAQYPNPSGIVTRARHFGIPVLINSGMGYYHFNSKIDKGIRIIESQNITKNEICHEINEGKKFSNVETVNGYSQAKIFIDAWVG